jgi:hypothetical protein
VSARCDERRVRPSYALASMPRHWIWMQVAIVVFVLIGMVIAIVRLA